MRTITNREQLLESFQRCLQYRQARSWRKPLISPSRFFRNQLRRWGFGVEEPGVIRKADTFHLNGFALVSGEGLSEQLGSYGIFEPELTGAFLQLIQPGAVVVDIGMHLGYYTVLFALLAGPEGEVHAFEPTPSTREVASRNTSRFPQVKVHPEAMWSGSEQLEFHDYGLRWMAFNSFTDAKAGGENVAAVKTFKVQTTTLDAFREQLNRKIDFLKIDAESAEEAILKGGKRVLQEDRPIISVEVGDRPGSHDSKRVVELLADQRYRAWEFSGGAFQRHQGREEYAYGNLIFAPEEMKELGRNEG